MSSLENNRRILKMMYIHAADGWTLEIPCSVQEVSQQKGHGLLAFADMVCPEPANHRESKLEVARG